MRRAFRRRHTEVEVHTASAPALPPLDETTFQQLLEAAYVIQEQRAAVTQEQREPRVPLPVEKPVPQFKEFPAVTGHADAQPLNAAEVLALIVETQEQLRSQVRDLPSAGKLIAERLEQVTNAAGVAIAVIREDHLEFCAATGVLSSLAGSSAPVGSSLPEFLHAHSWSSVELSIRHDAKCPIVFPIFHEGRTTGLLHLSFPATDKLEEHQIRSCQVMAGLMGEAISRASELEWKQTLAAERNTMMQILERLRPQLERLASESTTSEENLTGSGEDKSATVAAKKRQGDKLTILPAGDEARLSIRSTPSCQQCGFEMKEDEVFCGKCGAPQLDLTAPLTLPHEETVPQLSPELPEDLTTAKNLQPPADANSGPEQDVPLSPSLEQALAHLPTRDVVERFRPRVNPMIDAPTETVEPRNNEILRDTALRDGSINLQLPEHTPRVPMVPEPAGTELTQPGTNPETSSGPESQAAAEAAEVSSAIPAGITQPQPPKPSPWGSAAQAHQWLKSLQSAQSPTRVWINKHRADLWVVVSLILLLLALSGWGSRTAIYGAAQAKVVQPSLTLFERLLVALDLAEPPPAPVYMGNPNARVWIDQHTGLYYCPGADLYGNTQQGRFESQREALLDAFQPAARAYCQ